VKTITFQALGTTAQLTLADPARAAEAEALMRARLDDIDRAASRFRPDSELMLVQAMPGGPRRISSLLAGAVHAALAAARDTGGLVDPTVSPTGDGRPTPGWRRVEFDPHRRILDIPAGVGLDLGATGKALIADRIARDVNRLVASPVLVSLGGDIAVAGRHAWDVGIADDHAATRPDQVVRIHRGGIATSSTSVRPGHIIDPATGAPAATPWRTVTVAARTCLGANTASTAAIVMGERAPGWLAERDLAARLVAEDGTVVRVGGWPA
jgi:thiamine biosynthesis lipoprotein